MSGIADLVYEIIGQKSLADLKKEDVIRLIQHIECSDMSYDTKLDYKVAIRKFMKWLRKTEDYPEEVRWIKTRKKKNAFKLPEELLNEEEVSRMIDAAEYPRDKAMISSLFESGCRTGELLTMRVKHLQLDEYGAVFMINGKTGGRRVRLITSTPYLIGWLNVHPHRDDPEAPLWEVIRSYKTDMHTFVNYACLNVLLKRVARKAGIKKRVYPHLFRHSRATALANHLTEAQMKEYLGWVRDSDMASVYIHLSGRDVDDAVLRMHGLKKEENGKKKVAELCFRCKTALRKDAKFCDKCGLVLDPQTAMKLEQKQKGANNLLELAIQEDPALLQDSKSLSEFIQKEVDRHLVHRSAK
jgi:integrase